MASVMGINKRSYLYQMQEQLQYVLTNLDTENLSDDLRTKLQGL